VLERMQRLYTRDEYMRRIDWMKQARRNISITTDIIVGFPGETEADFEQLRDFVKAGRFDRLGVFAYSDEDASASFHLDAKVDGRTIQNRKRKLMADQRRVARVQNRAMVGETVDVLVEGLSEETDLLWQARMSTQAPEIDGFCYINDVEGSEPRPGEIRRLRITEAHDYDLIGTLLEPTESHHPRQPEPFPILAATR
jgi:ribosomal protein S12 methylthiotransferase